MGDPRDDRRGDTRRDLAVVAVLAAVTGLATWVALPTVRAIDLEVYRTAGVVWRDGLPLYRDGYPHGLGVYLPFTYPPFAAVVLGSLSFLPSPLAVGLVTVVGLLLLAVTTRLAWAGAPLPVPPRWRPVLVVALGTVVVWSEPVQDTLFFGQVNLVLLGLVALDVLPARTRLPRGVLIGLAAATKLTPAAFVLVLLCRRQWRAAGTAVATAALATGVGALVLPADSRDFWLGGVLTDPSRVGSAQTASNQSLAGVLARLGLGDAHLLWAALVVVGLLTVAATLERVRRHDDLGALLTTAAGALLVSPISWSHHWVWCAPGLVWLVRRALVRRTTGAWLLTTAVAAVAVVGPHRFFPSQHDRELHWAWWQHLVGDAYAWGALAVVACGAVAGVRLLRADRRSERPVSTLAVADPEVSAPR